MSSRRMGADPRSGGCRYHGDEVTARWRSRIPRGLVFATPLVETGQDPRTVPELLAHKDVSTAMIGTHVLNQPGWNGFRFPDARRVWCLGNA